MKPRHAHRRRQWLAALAGLTLAPALGLAAPAQPPARVIDARSEAYPYSGPPAPEAKPLPVLVLTGADFPGHVWRETTPVLAEALRQDPRADVRIVEDAHFMDSSALSRYRVVVLHYMNWRTPAPGAAARENLQRFVEDGGGLVLVHFACGTWLDWAQFRELAGRVWNPRLRGHDRRGPFRVNIIEPDHPITRGLSSFETDDELYTCLDGDTPIQVLATATSRVDQRDYPMAFVLEVGKGRVFHSPLGHDVKALGQPTLELFRRGVAWAAGFQPMNAP